MARFHHDDAAGFQSVADPVNASLLDLSHENSRRRECNDADQDGMTDERSTHRVPVRDGRCRNRTHSNVHRDIEVTSFTKIRCL
jgi:hypothetical protein